MYGTGSLQLGSVQRFGRQSYASKKMSDLDDLIFREIATSRRTKRDRLAVQSDCPITAVRFMYFATATQQRTDIVPLNIVIQRMSENLLHGEAMVVVQLEWHSQSLHEGRGRLPSLALSPFSSALSRIVTNSTCSVIGNRSNARISPSANPPANRIFRSRANVAASHET